MTQPLTWLHLSDMHIGARGKSEWHHTLECFRQHISTWTTPPDLVLITGDLTNSAKPSEFTATAQCLARLDEWLGATPPVIPVPGNHDLARPDRRDPNNHKYALLSQYANGDDTEGVRNLKQLLWQHQDASFLSDLFKPYTGFLSTHIIPRLNRPGISHQLSFFPGDLRVDIALPERPPLTIAALNSTWLHWCDGDMERRLQVDPGQLHGLFPAPEDLAHLHQAHALLLLHHPPAWLSKHGQRLFEDDINSAHRFSACCYGHMHESAGCRTQHGDGSASAFFQAPSLFGVEHWGTARESRAMGFTWGQLTADGAIRVWPYRLAPRRGRFIFDHEHFAADEGSGYLLHPGATAHMDVDTPTIALPPAVPTQISRIPTDALNRYLQALIKDTDHITLAGIYTTLRGRSAADGALEPHGLDDPLPPLVTALAQQGGRSLIEGQPGSGKTTCLKLAACMLARDRKTMANTNAHGPRYSAQYLQWPEHEKIPIPVLISMADLPLPTGKLPHGAHHGTVLLNYIATIGAGHGLTKDHWRQALAAGEVMLLLDGLDEVTEPTTRENLLRVLRSACDAWQQCAITVTSRPIQTETLAALGFNRTVVAPLDKAAIRWFIEHWCAALAIPPDSQVRLEHAITERPTVRRLAANPVMLTSLCVVHWRGGELPEGRARVYRMVIGWLLDSRAELRRKQDYDQRFAEEALCALALAMMGGRDADSKISAVNLEQAAHWVVDTVAVHYPQLSDTLQLQKARQWLHFEGLYSGILEERGHARFRFWHLTFQEFLAALALVRLRDGDGPSHQYWWPVVEPRLEAVQWQETLSMLAPCLFEEGGRERVNQLAERVLALRRRPGAEPLQHAPASPVCCHASYNR